MDDLLPIYGETFLRYVLAIDDPDDPIPQELSAHQREVASALRQVASQAPADPQRIGQYTHLSNLGRWQEESGSSIANALRVHAGGELPAVPDSANPLVDHLTKVARDIWPSMLLPLPTISPASFWHSTPIGVFVHPETIEAGKAFLRDTKLRKLFPGSPSGTAIDALNMSSLVEVNAYWTTNAGRGGTQGLMTLLGLLISNSHLRSIMRRGRSSWEALVAEIPNTVAEMKKLANSETVDVPRSIGFLGLTVPDEVVVTLPHGTLRGLRQGDRDYLLPESTSATCIFLTTFPLRLLEIETWNPTSQIDPLSQRSSGVWEVARADLQAAERKIDLTRLAVLLSSPEDKTWALAQISSLIADPTSPGGISQWSAQRYGVNYGELDDAAGGRIGAWWEILNEHHPTSLDIAMRRVLSAAGNRLDPIDGFVDAVVAWENCFGTATETTFRVTASLSMILEPDSGSSRLALQKRLKKLYEKRSRVVHGALQLSPQEASLLRDEALDIAKRCLRQLYTTRTDLLGLKSEERSARVLLD